MYNKITATPTAGEWPPTVGWPLAKCLPYIFIESMSPTVDLVSDEFPEGRYKLIHSVGGAASFKIDWDSNPYTGLFQGSDYGLLRFASASEPKEGAGNNAVDSGFVPGIGMKFLRDGVESANVVFLHKLTAADSWNFFKHMQSNHLSANNLGTAETVLKAKFETSGSSWVNMVGLSHLATYDQKGAAVDSSKLSFPFQLVIVPTDTMATRFPDEYDKPLIEQLREIEIGTILYEVHAKADYDAPLTKIGSLKLTSKIESSVYADQKLFLKHQTMEEDFALKPEWGARCPTNDDCLVCPVDTGC